MSRQLAGVAKNRVITNVGGASSAFAAQAALPSHACIHRDAVGSFVSPGAAGLVRDAIRTPGEPLDQPTLDLMGPHFGHDLSGVRVHTDSLAAESSMALNANAYTLGNHIVFDQGKYQPHKMEGIHLLAHELSHVHQQAYETRAPRDWGHLQVSDSGDAAERQAVSSADHIVDHLGHPDGTRPSFGPGGPGTVHRDKKRAPAKEEKKAPIDQKPAETKDFAEAEWEDTQAFITHEFENAYQDIVRVAAADAKWQVHDLVEPYSGSLSDPNKTFLAIAGAFLGGAGNFPNDPPLPSTSRFAATQSISVSGGLAGLATQAMQGALGILLDTGSIDEIKQNTNLNIEEMISEEMTIDSPEYERYEFAQMARMHAMFNGLVELSKMEGEHPEKRENAQFRRKFMNEVVRKEYGVHGDTGKQVLETVGDQLHQYLEKNVRPQLVTVKHEQDNRRMNMGVFSGLLGGAIIGGSLGYEFGGGAQGIFPGLVLGMMGGMALGAIGAALFTKKDPAAEEKSPSERRRDRLKKKQKGIERLLPAPFG